MKKKLGWALVAVIVIVCVVVGSQYFAPKAHEGEKEIEIQVVDATKDKEVLQKTFYTDAKTLTEFLEEIKEIGKNYTEAEICGLKQDMEKGPWLVFESENNTVCKEAGMCPAMDEVVIEDGDAFTFKLISSFE